MALYINNTANIFEIEEKETKKGQPYVTCNVVFYSKSKDENGKFTKKDAPFTIRGNAFGSAALYLLKHKDEKNVFVTILGKLADVEYEKEEEKKYTKRINILTVTAFEAHKGAEDEENDEEYEEADV